MHMNYFDRATALAVVTGGRQGHRGKPDPLMLLPVSLPRTRDAEPIKTPDLVLRVSLAISPHVHSSLKAVAASQRSITLITRRLSIILVPNRSGERHLPVDVALWPSVCLFVCVCEAIIVGFEEQTSFIQSC